MTKKDLQDFALLARQLVSDVQGAPFPNDNIEAELYSIWYEHVQRDAQNFLEYLDRHFPVDSSKFQDALKKMFK